MIKQSMQDKLLVLAHRYAELGGLLSDATVINDQSRYRQLSQEYAELEPIAQSWQAYQAAQQAVADAKCLLQEDDAEMRALAKDEIATSEATLNELSDQLMRLLIPKDPRDQADVYLEVRAGTGGQEAALFAGDLFRMYTRYAEKMGWRYQLMSCSESEQGGYKTVTLLVTGQGVYSKLKFESGAHRVQRVPQTESQGRVHTSACTVAVIAAVEAIDSVDINPADLRIDTFRASGAGGQHVNKTDSAIRITHIPTGVVVECQDERSQHKNKARALSMLQSRILDQQQQEQQAEQAALRKDLVGSGDRSDRIRTYNFPQGRVTDHRINLTLYQLDSVMEGDMSMVIDPLTQELEAAQLAALDEVG